MASRSTKKIQILSSSRHLSAINAQQWAAKLCSTCLCAAVLSFTFGLSPINNAYAQGSDEQRRAAIASAISKAGGYGKVLSVKPHPSAEDKPGFRIRILIDGRVRTFDIPTQSR